MRTAQRPKVATMADSFSSSTSSSAPSSSPSSLPSSLSSFPLLSFVSYNHELLKLRLVNLHTDWLYQYKLSTEKPIDEQRKHEFIRGHSLHIPGFSLSNYPIRKVWSTLSTAASTAEDAPAAEAKKRWAAPSLRRGSDSMLGASSQIFTAVDDRRAFREDEEAARQLRFARRRARQQRWKAEVDAATAALNRRAVSAKAAVDDASADERKSDSPVEGRSSAASLATSSSPSRSPLAGRSGSPTSVGRGVAASPVSFGASVGSSAAVPALCEECGCRIDSVWAVCDFCGYDPLADDDDDEEEGGRKRKKRKRAQRMQAIMQAQQINEKKAKAQEEMRLLAETMSPWEQPDAVP